MNRRDFLKGAGAAAIVPAAIPGAIWPPDSFAARDAGPDSAASVNIPPVTAVVYDERYPDCRLFADALTLHGAIAFPAYCDSAQLWYGALGAHLARRPGRVAGLTTYADFSVSQSCGRELNLVTLYQGAHDARRSRTKLTHRLRFAGDQRDLAATFANAGAGANAAWAAALAGALSRLPSDAVASPGPLFATTPRSAGHPGYLVSWLLVP